MPTRKGEMADKRRVHRGAASMGPRRCRRGRVFPPRRPACTAMLQWGRVVADAEGCRPRSTTRSRHSSFNGAASLPTRKAAAPTPRPGTGCRASMGPRRCRRGRTARAAVLSVALHRASMGPRRCRRGRHEPSGARTATTRALQWGRVVADAEGTTSSSSCPDPVGSASMGPRRCRRGRPRGVTRAHRALPASMGPRRCRRGRRARRRRCGRAIDSFNGAASLPTRTDRRRGGRGVLVQRASMGPRRCRRGRGRRQDP